MSRVDMTREFDKCVSKLYVAYADFSRGQRLLQRALRALETLRDPLWNALTPAEREAMVTLLPPPDRFMHAGYQTHAFWDRAVDEGLSATVGGVEWCRRHAGTELATPEWIAEHIAWRARQDDAVSSTFAASRS